MVSGTGREPTLSSGFGQSRVSAPKRRPKPPAISTTSLGRASTAMLSTRNSTARNRPTSSTIGSMSRRVARMWSTRFRRLMLG